MKIRGRHLSGPHLAHVEQCRAHQWYVCIDACCDWAAVSITRR